VDAHTLVEITRARLKKHEGQYAEIARQTPGLSYSWLTKFAHGQADNPTVANLQTLKEALDAFEGVFELPIQEPENDGARH
jgi:transcriptional regulator with XRE-family HTH domain